MRFVSHFDRRLINNRDDKVKDCIQALFKGTLGPSGYKYKLVDQFATPSGMRIYYAIHDFENVPGMRAKHFAHPPQWGAYHWESTWQANGALTGCNLACGNTVLTPR